MAVAWRNPSAEAPRAASISTFGQPIIAKDREIRDEAIIRDLLERIDDSPDVSQRALAQELGIALGMANAYLKRCVKKGWVKVSEAPLRRFRYYVTPTGFAEKTRLTAQYFSDSLKIFRRSRQSFDRLFAELSASGVRRIVLCGDEDLCEVGVLCSLSSPLDVVGIYDPSDAEGAIRALPAVSLDDPEVADRWVLAANADTWQLHRRLVRVLGAERVAVPDILARRLSNGGVR